MRFSIAGHSLCGDRGWLVFKTHSDCTKYLSQRQLPFSVLMVLYSQLYPPPYRYYRYYRYRYYGTVIFSNSPSSCKLTAGYKHTQSALLPTSISRQPLYTPTGHTIIMRDCPPCLLLLARPVMMPLCTKLSQKHYSFFSYNCQLPFAIHGYIHV